MHICPRMFWGRGIIHLGAFIVIVLLVVPVGWCFCSHFLLSILSPLSDWPLLMLQCHEHGSQERIAFVRLQAGLNCML